MGLSQSLKKEIIRGTYSMKDNRLHQRLKKLSSETGFRLSEIAVKSGLSREGLYKLRRPAYKGAMSKTLRMIAVAFDMIPVVFHIDKPDGVIEDLGDKIFIHGKEVDNYIGRSIKKHRLLRGMTKTDLARKIGLSPKTIYNYERTGSKLNLNYMEIVSAGIDLYPEYLKEKSREYKALRIINDWIQNKKDLSPGQRKEAMFYAAKLTALL